MTAKIDYTEEIERPIAVFDTTHGQFEVELYAKECPETVWNFINLAEGRQETEKGGNFYDGLTFHRIIDGFMVQGGDPDGDGSGGPGFSFDDQLHTDLQFTGPGVLALANSGSDTNGSQFFITTDEYRYGDFRYTIIGQLVEGADVLEQIQNVSVHENANEEVSEPDYTVTITSITTFTDDQNGVGKDACFVHVLAPTPPDNLPPSADAGVGQIVTDADGDGVEAVQLQGSAADTDGTVVAYAWTQTGGGAVSLVNATSAKSVFTAPDVGPSGASLTFRLTVTDDGGLQSTDTCVVNVSWTDDVPPAPPGGFQVSSID